METMIWPVYIDSKKSRNEGRKVSKEYAVSKPKLTEISRAARKLNLNSKVEDDKSYPGSWWEHSGRVIVERENTSKNEILVKISETIKKLREK